MPQTQQDRGESRRDSEVRALHFCHADSFPILERGTRRASQAAGTMTPPRSLERVKRDKPSDPASQGSDGYDGPADNYDGPKTGYDGPKSGYDRRGDSYDGPGGGYDGPGGGYDGPEPAPGSRKSS
jgi:hypothetical protein